MALRLVIELRRKNPTHHLFRYARADGSGGEIELETKSFLSHDLLHFAVEMEAKIDFGFYGLLARGEWNRDRAEAEPEKTEKTMEVEQVVGMLAGWFKEPREDDREFLRRLEELRGAQALSPITWITSETIVGVRGRMRALLGEWNHTEFHTPMKLVFEIV